MALACPHCNVTLTRSEAEDRKCPACHKTFTKAVETMESDTGDQARDVASTWHGTMCDLCGKKKKSVERGYLTIGFGFVTGTIFTRRWLGWCNLSSQACGSCRLYINMWPVIYVILMVLPLFICFVPPLVVEKMQPNRQDLVRSMIMFSIIAALVPVAMLGLFFAMQMRRNKRLLGQDAHDALYNQYGMYNIAFKRRLPSGEGSITIADAAKGKLPQIPNE
jgi:hypothetical protein